MKSQVYILAQTGMQNKTLASLLNVSESLLTLCAKGERTPLFEMLACASQSRNTTAMSSAITHSNCVGALKYQSNCTNYYPTEKWKIEKPHRVVL